MIFALEKELRARKKEGEPNIEENKKIKITDLLSKEGKYNLAHIKEFKKGIEANYNLNLFKEKEKEIENKIINKINNFKEIEKKFNKKIEEKNKELKEKEEDLTKLNEEAIDLSREVKKDMIDLQKSFEKNFEFRKNQSLQYLDNKIKKLEKIKELKKDISLQEFNKKNNNFILKNEYKEKIIKKNMEYLEFKKEKQKEINNLIIEKNKIILEARKKANIEKLNYLNNKKNYYKKNQRGNSKTIRNLENRIKKYENKKVFTPKELDMYTHDKNRLSAENYFNKNYSYMFEYRGGSPNYCYAHNIPKGKKGEYDLTNITFGEYLKKQLIKDKIFDEFYGRMSRFRFTERENMDKTIINQIKGLLAHYEF
jgi:hypothetical protein